MSNPEGREQVVIRNAIADVAANCKPDPRNIRFAWQLVGGMFGGVNEPNNRKGLGTEGHSEYQAAAFAINVALRDGTGLSTEIALTGHRILREYLRDPEGNFELMMMTQHMEMNLGMSDEQLEAAERFFKAMGEVLPPELPL